MSRLIAEQSIQEVSSRVDIVEVISSYIPLKRAGRNFKALCPFHHEKTPSFMVNPDKQIFHCFGCGVGGDVFSFLMKYERMEFPEVVQTLAKKVGVILPRQPQEEQAEGVTTQLYQVMQMAAEFYHQFLKDSPEAEPARHYLRRRGVTDKSIEDFTIGYAPAAGDKLLSFLRTRNISLALQEKAGVIVGREGGGYIDRFRKRITFPIRDIRSRIVGFGARVLDDSLPKYINSPETPVYSKGRCLYGLHTSRSAIQKEGYAVMVEGYLDFVTCYQQGLVNVVAASGTALTLEQIRLLRRYTNHLVLVFDADQAGEMATLRNLDPIIEEDLMVKIVSLPEGFDPDSYVKKDGIAAFCRLLESCQNIFDYKLNLLQDRYNAKEPEGKASIAAEMLPTIKRLKNEVLRDSYIRKLAQILEVDQGALILEMKKIKEYGHPSQFSRPASSSRSASASQTEKILLRLLLEEAQFALTLKESQSLEFFSDGLLKDMVTLIGEWAHKGEEVSPGRLIRHFQDERVTQLVTEACSSEECYDPLIRQKIFSDCLQWFKEKARKMECARLQEEISRAQTKKDQARLKVLMGEYNALIKRGAGKHEKR